MVKNKLAVQFRVLSILLLSTCISGCVGSGHKKEGHLDVNSDNENEALLTRGKQIASVVSEELVGKLSGAVTTFGVVGAVNFCALNAVPITDSISNSENVRISRVSHKPRNPQNKANAAELELVHAYSEATADSKVKTQPVLRTENGAKVFYAPIYVASAMCLNCHGKIGEDIVPEVKSTIDNHYPTDEATGFAIGDLRGLMKIIFDDQQESTAFIEDVKPQAFKLLAESGDGIILDVRTPEEVAFGHIEGASIIDFYDDAFTEKINLMDKTKPIYVYCKSGGRSAQAAEILHQNGFPMVYQLVGGTMAWESEGFKLTPPSTQPDEKIESLSLESFNNLLDTDMPVLVDFHTIWCAPCKKMVPIIEKVESTYAGKALVKRIDADNSKGLATEYNIKGVPVFLLFKHGEIKWRHTGVISEEEIVLEIEKYL